MRLYTVEHQGKALVCLEDLDGRLAILPYETMNDLLTDDPANRDQILVKLAPTVSPPVVPTDPVVPSDPLPPAA